MITHHALLGPRAFQGRHVDGLVLDLQQVIDRHLDVRQPEKFFRLVTRLADREDKMGRALILASLAGRYPLSWLEALPEVDRLGLLARMLEDLSDMLDLQPDNQQFAALVLAISGMIPSSILRASAIPPAGAAGDATGGSREPLRRE